MSYIDGFVIPVPSAKKEVYRAMLVEGQRPDDGRHVSSGEASQPLVEAAGDVVQGGLVGASVELDKELPHGALGEDEDEAGQAVTGLDQIETPQSCGVGLGRRGDAGRVRGPGQRRGSQAEPLLAGELHLAELMADHELLDGR